MLAALKSRLLSVELADFKVNGKKRHLLLHLQSRAPVVGVTRTETFHTPPPTQKGTILEADPPSC